MFKAVAAIAFSLLTLTGAAATEASLYVPYDIDVSITASMDQPSVEFMGDGIAAERAGLAAFFEQSFAPLKASVDQPPVEFMGDGIAAERAGLAADMEPTFATLDTETLAQFGADLAALEPTETGSSLTLMAWEAEEPLLLKAYFESRAAREAMLTP